MSSLTKALLASALTLPLVAFAAGVLASPDDVDPDRSRPVIIGKVDDDSGQQPPRERAPDEGRKAEPQDPPQDDDGPDDDADDDTDDGRGAPPADDATDDRASTSVPPAPRDLDDDEDGGDDDNDDNTDDGRESRDD